MEKQLPFFIAFGLEIKRSLSIHFLFHSVPQKKNTYGGNVVVQKRRGSWFKNVVVQKRRGLKTSWFKNVVAQKHRGSWLKNTFIGSVPIFKKTGISLFNINSVRSFIKNH